MIFKYEIRDQERDAALYHIAKQGERAYFQPELAAHVHRARVSAPHLAHVFMLYFGNEQGKVETADEVRDDCHHDEPIPDIRKC